MIHVRIEPQLGKVSAMSYIKAEYNDQKVCLSANQVEALNVLTSTNGGGIATIHDYVSTSGRVTPETANITFISRFSVSRLYDRRKAFLETLVMDDVNFKEPKLTGLSLDALSEAFTARKATMIASITKTQQGDRSDAHRQGHDRCYHTICEGVKLHFKTFTDSDGLKQPIDIDGYLVVESIMLNIIEISRKVTIPGEYKTVNSGVPVLIENAIQSVMPRSCKIKAISLKDDNFSSLKIAGNEMLPEDFSGLFT